MLLKICNRLAKVLPGITIALPDPADNIKKPYLSRFYFFLKDRKFFNIFLHHFHRSDADQGLGGYGLLHDHPFKWSFSVVLIAGYSEERLAADGVVYRHQVKPWSINFIKHGDFHRVDLYYGEAWTLFFTGSRVKNGDWFFFDRVSKEKRHWTTSPNSIA